MSKGIKCGVMNCYYNASGMCDADNIEVKSQSVDSADDSLGTYCETFKPGD